jgi:hypothetical protein
MIYAVRVVHDLAVCITDPDNNQCDECVPRFYILEWI